MVVQAQIRLFFYNFSLVRPSMASKFGFSEKEKILIIENLANLPPRQAAREAKKLLGLKKVPHHTSISRVIQSWRERGSVKRKTRVAKPPKVVTPVRKHLRKIAKQRDEKISIRKIKAKLGISYGSTQKLMHKELGFAYKKRRVQTIGGESGRKNRLEFANALLANNGAWLSKIKQFFWVVDECDIEFQPPVNPQNDRIWAKTMPSDGSNLLERRRSKKLSVFIGLFTQILLIFVGQNLF